MVLTSSREIKTSIQQIKLYCLHQPSIQQNHLESIDEVENILMNFINMNLKQKYIDDFFNKLFYKYSEFFLKNPFLRIIDYS